MVVDATAASRRAVEYVGRLLAACADVECRLAYLVPHLPPALLESGGSERPEREVQIEAELRHDQRRWTAEAQRKANRILRAARTTIEDSGVDAARIQTCTTSPLDAGPAAAEVLRLARSEGCRTVALGHRTHTWFRGLGGGDLAEHLARQAKGLAVWVIG